MGCVCHRLNADWWERNNVKNKSVILWGLRMSIWNMNMCSGLIFLLHPVELWCRESPQMCREPTGNACYAGYTIPWGQRKTGEGYSRNLCYLHYNNRCEFSCLTLFSLSKTILWLIALFSSRAETVVIRLPAEVIQYSLKFTRPVK